ncbi:hypothetical protein AGABI2DRAFT_122763 [Agaricus bisporus var. bisporus H97]|uniref:hypothetical protein n=1 Tax=Agaricus bisporus var. bisporus (strain H97 / ATCC MYA-4626 / FGSC 10389) TaxID=936046 RepID=UPI00029F574C|nr:hypothetical protein AGABI2DRAFT_122763 [Agaricus bisporus var. bisporus H97]EKV42545.1 hypothetical protein AGABI2DRAFT_122763 [Agaricus bisporus var. bisporus H97]
MASSIQEHENTRQDDHSQATMIRPVSRLHRLTAILGLVFDSAIVFLSGGVPYWYYRFAHPRFPHDRERELGESASATILNYEEHWSNKVPQIFKVWKTHRLIVGAVLAPMFPLLSVSPLPKCSWAYIFAILCLLYGLITIAICVFHAIYFHDIDASKLSTIPDGGFFCREILHLYVFLSLPTVWFAGFVASFGMAILMLIIGVQNSPHDLEINPSSSSRACINNPTFLLAVVPIILIIAATSFVRSIKYASRKLSPSTVIPGSA